MILAIWFIIIACILLAASDRFAIFVGSCIIGFWALVFGLILLSPFILFYAWKFGAFA